MHQNFGFGWRSAPDPAGELSALPSPPSCILGGPTSKGRKGRRRGENNEGEGKGGKQGGKGRRGP